MNETIKNEGFIFRIVQKFYVMPPKWKPGKHVFNRDLCFHPHISDYLDI